MYDSTFPLLWHRLITSGFKATTTLNLIYLSIFQVVGNRKSGFVRYDNFCWYFGQSTRIPWWRRMSSFRIFYCPIYFPLPRLNSRRALAQTSRVFVNQDSNQMTTFRVQGSAVTEQTENSQFSKDTKASGIFEFRTFCGLLTLQTVTVGWFYSGYFH